MTHTPLRPRLPLLRPRTLLLALALLAQLVVLPSQSPAEAVGPYDAVIDLTFPFTRGANVAYGNDYHASRSGGRIHQSTDLMVAYGTPVHAVMGGTVRRTAGDASGPASWGYAVTIRGDDGREYWYLHLGRQDRPPSSAYAEGIRAGERVERGELLGWAGCSGSATCGGGEHLHLEIHDTTVRDPYDYHDHERMNPYASLRAAEQRGDYADRVTPWRATPADPDRLPVPAGWRWADVAPDGIHADAITLLSDEGVVDACAGTRFCPSRELKRREMARFLVAELDLPAGDHSFSDVPRSDPDAAAVAALAASGITAGCAADRYCPDAWVSRGQMARFLDRALALPDAAEPFSDVAADGVHSDSIGALVAAGITLGCNADGTRFCPRRAVTRAQIASFLVRARDVERPSVGDDADVRFLVGGVPHAAGATVDVEPTTRVASFLADLAGLPLVGDVDRVRFAIDGREVNVEQAAPYDLFGSGGLDAGELLPAGSHRLTATFVLDDGSRREGSLTLRVAGAEVADAAVVFEVAGTDVPAGRRVDVTATTRIAARLVVDGRVLTDAAVERVWFAVDGGGVNTERSAPYDLFGSDGLAADERLPAGEHVVSATFVLRDGDRVDAQLPVRVAG